jgi:hypothetical protein
MMRRLSPGVVDDIGIFLVAALAVALAVVTRA